MLLCINELFIFLLAIVFASGFIGSRNADWLISWIICVLLVITWNQLQFDTSTDSYRLGLIS